MFNMGESGDSNVKDGEEFLTVFWRKFNEMRGYSSTNLALAHFLERPLDKGGKFADFKAKIAEKDYNWEDDRSDLAGTMLDTVLDAAKAVMPELTTDAIRENIINNRITLSVASFMSDVKEWLATQGSDSRIVFCVDEISQYISNRSQLLLQLQEIVTGSGLDNIPPAVHIPKRQGVGLDMQDGPLGGGLLDFELGKSVLALQALHGAAFQLYFEWMFVHCAH